MLDSQGGRVSCRRCVPGSVGLGGSPEPAFLACFRGALTLLVWASFGPSDWQVFLRPSHMGKSGAGTAAARLKRGSVEMGRSSVCSLVLSLGGVQPTHLPDTLQHDPPFPPRCWAARAELGGWRNIKA